MAQDDEGSVLFLWDPQEWPFFNSDSLKDDMTSKKPLGSTTSSPHGQVGEKRQHTSDDSKSSKGKVMSNKGKGKAKAEASGGDSDHEAHIWTERERRKKMRDMFSSLHALLPHIPSKADKSTVVDEAMNHIKSMEQTLEKLQKQKQERMKTAELPSPSSDVVVVVQPPGSRSREAFLADHSKNFLAVNTSSRVVPQVPWFNNMYSFQTWTSPNVVLNVTGNDAQISICTTKKPGILSIIFLVMQKHNLKVLSASISSDQFKVMYMILAHAINQHPEQLMIEEIFKLAVEELIMWLSS